ncbi:MAG TPA: asparagine synthetase B family protein [Capsulimonadaceae bacterium]|jgi:asparagine synthase (glutamine-hydrolysing)
MSNAFLGSIGGESADSLPFQGTGVWRCHATAFAGSEVATDASGRYSIAGEALLDNASTLAQSLGLPALPHLALLAELYQRYGIAAGRMALGMFAVAVHDRDHDTVTLMRDGVGARTMYFASQGPSTWFASRLRTLHAIPNLSGQLSLTALRRYLTCAFVPGSETSWEGISELDPGESITFPGGKRQLFWRLEESAWDDDEPLEISAARLRGTIDEAVRDRLPASGEPVGVFLSGGLDSSLVTALAAKLHSGPVHTFSIHFGKQHRSELEFSDLVAQHCGTIHHVLELPAKTIMRRLHDTHAALDDPIGDPLTTPNSLVGELAAQHVKVVLNGEGGDPCFGGPKNSPMLLHRLYGEHESFSSAYMRSFQKCFDDLDSLLLPEVKRHLLTAEPQETLFEPYFSGELMSDGLNQLMHVNTFFKGASHILTKVNNLTSANGLIGRSPLFDRRVVEASFGIAPRHKLAAATEKAVLKAASVDLLPASIIHRPKSGMLVPVQYWFRNELRGYAADMLLGKQARTSAYFDRRTVKSWINYRGGVWPRHGVKLWLLLALEIWLRAQEDTR